MAAYCDDGKFAVSRTGPWGALDHYAPWDPKRIGFLHPQNSPLELRQKYGFTRPYVDGNDFTLYTNPPASGGYGYNAADLLAGIYYTHPSLDMDQCPGVEEFYVDEPYTAAGWGMQDIINVADYVHGRNKRFGVGEQASLLLYPSSARTYFNQSVVPHLDFVTYTNYQKHSASGGDDDQRDSWTELRNTYGTKFDRVWISSVKDGLEYSTLGDEYSNLLGHASNLGITIAMFFQGGGTQRQLDSFCSAARNNGWLRKFVKEIQQNWCCDTQQYNPDTCYMRDSFETGRIVEL